MKRYRVVVAPEVFDAIDRQVEYLAVTRHAPLNAERWLRKVLEAVEELATFPAARPHAPESEAFGEPLRFQLVGSHLLLFTIDDAYGAVRVVGFRHGRRQSLRPE